MSEEEKRQNVEEQFEESRKVLHALQWTLPVGIVLMAVFAALGAHPRLRAFTNAVLLAAAAAMIGAATGFLFGIPRTLQQETEDSAAAGRMSGRRVDYLPNTNLEQISDWLTKILVGVGLTQIHDIRSGAKAVTAFAARGLGGDEYARAFALSLLVLYLLVGFLHGYLWTRIYFAIELRSADNLSAALRLQKVEAATERTQQEVDDLKKQSFLDARALNLVYKQLSPLEDAPWVDDGELGEAIKAASEPVRIQVFNQAMAVRTATWSDPKTKPRMERTIPIFRSLIRADTEGRFHQNHGQLGYALKDKTNAEWDEAEKELDRAIQMRGPWKENGWPYYEFNRSLCRIRRDPGYLAGKPSADKDAL